MHRVSTVSVVVIAATLTAWIAGSRPAGAGDAETYVVLYKQQHVPAGAASKIARAGGTLIQEYDRIGVAIAHSESASFRDRMSRHKEVEGVAPTASFGMLIEPVDPGTGAPVAPVAPYENAVVDPLEALQWNMRQIHVPEAHTVTKGSSGVTVGVIDTGVDYAHPDLAPNIDFAASVSCVGGVPDIDPSAWMDAFGHGTHAAGIIAAADNEVGIVGVAPEVRVAAIKGCTDDGYCWPESVICAFMWAADMQLDVAHAGFFVDPYEFNCHNDPEQHAIWKAVRRSVRYAQNQGVTVVGPVANSNVDLAHPPGDLTNACDLLPVELSGVVGVSANGNLMQKSYFSSYGVGVVDVVAPGGDWRFQVTTDAPNGRVLSTIPPDSILATLLPALVVQDCSVTPCAKYLYLQDTATASAHVAGVASLVISRYGTLPPGSIAAHVARTADPMECPMNPFDPGPPYDFTAICQGGEGYNSFHGHGQVNASRAVGEEPDPGLTDPLQLLEQD